MALVDLDESALQETVRSIGEEKASYTVADVTQPEQAQAYINAAVDRWGGIDVLLANAGIEGTLSPITDYPIDVFDRVMAVNVRGVWLGIKYVVPVMSGRGGGSIVITSSTAGNRRKFGNVGIHHQQTCGDWPDAHRRSGGCSVRHQGQYRQPGTHRDTYDAFDRRHASGSA